MLTAKKHRLATSGEIKETFWFHEILSAAFQEVIAVSIDEGQIFITSHHFAKIWPIKTTVLITAFLSDHKLKGFQEILSLLSKAERIEMFKATVGFCLAKTSPSATGGTKIYK